MASSGKAIQLFSKLLPALGRPGEPFPSVDMAKEDSGCLVLDSWLSEFGQALPVGRWNVRRVPRVLGAGETPRPPGSQSRGAALAGCSRQGCKRVRCVGPGLPMVEPEQRSSRQSVDSRLSAGLKAAEGPGNLVFDPTVLNSNKIKVSVAF